MKYKSPSFTGTISLAIFLVFATGMPAEDDTPPSGGNALLSAAATGLEDLPAIEAKLRQRVKLFGHEMVGSGTYQQMTAGRQRMLRMELKMDVAGQVASFQQISDGTVMWIRRDSPAEQRLEYINLRQVRQAVSRQAGAAAATGNWFALGGLDQLLHELNRNFVFGEPAASQIGNVPVWELNGVWNSRALSQFGVTSAEALPEHLPHVVKVTLGRDQHLPLFPYRIEFGRTTANPESGATTSAATNYVAIAAMDLHGVHHRPDLAARHFQFQPNDQEVIDVTERQISRMSARLEPSSAVETR